MDTNKATIGRIVHVVLDENIPGIEPRAIGLVRPAIVVRTWGENGGPSSSINVQVFIDGINDLKSVAEPNYVWLTSVPFSTDPTPRTWHWPPR